MRIGSIVMLCAALLLGVAAAFLAKVWLESQKPAPLAAIERPAAPVRTVVVATKPLRFGMEVPEAALKEVEWPKGAIPEGAFSAIDQILDGEGERLVLDAIAENEPVLRAKITGPGQRATLSALVAPGKKAVAISVNDVLGVAGFVLPGERVDILLTQSEARELVGQPLRKTAFTDVLLENIRVLAVDQNTDDLSSKPELVKTVTVEVDTVQAQKIALATSIGTLSLALRSAGSTRETDAERISLADLNGRGTKSPASAITSLFGQDSTTQIVVTRAAERQEYSVPREAAVR